jgi:aspartyl-tRNA(Asn)/glutamyl-tRNA(Gln) amidotransferase subunit C
MFDNDKVKDVAKLAMIELDEEDVKLYSSEILNFLKIVEQSESIDVSSLSPLYHAPENFLNAREDVVDENPKNDGINSAPDQNGEYFIVPKVID